MSRKVRRWQRRTFAEFIGLPYDEAAERREWQAKVDAFRQDLQRRGRPGTPPSKPPHILRLEQEQQRAAAAAAAAKDAKDANVSDEKRKQT